MDGGTECADAGGQVGRQCKPQPVLTVNTLPDLCNLAGGKHPLPPAYTELPLAPHSHLLIYLETHTNTIQKKTGKLFFTLNLTLSVSHAQKHTI